MAEVDELIDLVRELEEEIDNPNPRDENGVLKIGTLVKYGSNVGVVVHIGKLEESYTGRQAYLICFAEWLARDYKRNCKFGIKDVVIWMDETQFTVLGE